MSLDYPQEYEFTDGSVFLPAWNGREVPVPPEWVRRQVDGGEPYRYLSLHPELGLFPEKIRKKAGAYVRDWPTVQRYGQHLWIIGERSWRWQERVAMATVNETVRLYGAGTTHRALRTSAASITSMHTRGIIDRENPEMFRDFRKQILQAPLLYFHDPLGIGMDVPWEVAQFVRLIYETRTNHRRPTISSLNIASGDDRVAYTRKILGRTVSDLLHDDEVTHSIIEY